MSLYRILLFSYLIDSIISLIPKLVLAALYLFASSLVLIMIISGSLSSTYEAMFHPNYCIYYLVQYMKWVWYSKTSLELRYFIYTMISLLSPYIIWCWFKQFSRKFIIYLKVKIRLLTRKLARQIARGIRKCFRKLFPESTKK